MIPYSEHNYSMTEKKYIVYIMWIIYL